MVRISKKDRPKRCPRKPRYGSEKTGSLKDNLSKGYKEHENAFTGQSKQTVFIGKVKQERIMSRHPSYGKSNKSGKKRNVLKRFERVDVLKKLGRWKEGESKKVTGLPKTPVVQ